MRGFERHFEKRFILYITHVVHRGYERDYLSAI